MSRTKTYVEFFYRGVLVPETSSKEVDKRDPDNQEVPKHAYAFRYYDVLVDVLSFEGEEHELRSARINYSATYYLPGRAR